jgi:hypothetical protein
MPPRFSYWTIIIDNQPTAFRAAMLEDLLPTFNRLKLKHPTAVMMWFQRGRLWPSRQDAQAALVAERRNTNRPRWSGPSGQHPPPRRESRDRRPRPDDRRPPGHGDAPRGNARPPHAPGGTGRRPGRRDGRGGPPGGGPPAAGGPPRDRTWRPGGQHRDPRQKFKDAKKAKWTRFKQRIRQRVDRRNAGKKKDDES